MYNNTHASVLLPEGQKWWRLLSRSLPACVDDRIDVGDKPPTRRPSGLGRVGVGKFKSDAVWGQWESAAITFAGAAESDVSGKATDTGRRKPLSYDDCVNLANKCSKLHPGTKVVDIPLPHADRRACVVYIPQFFNSNGVSNEQLVNEMRRVKPDFIDRHSQNRGPTKTHHKNLRWNTNITDSICARRPDIYNMCLQATAEAKRKFSETQVRSDCYIEKLPSSEIPFSHLPGFRRARAKITALGAAALRSKQDVDIKVSTSSAAASKPSSSSLKHESVQKNENLKDLCCELNFYFGAPSQPGGIGFHGDAERNLVFGGSIGSTDRMIEWCRFEKDKPYIDPSTGRYEIYRLTLRPGDAYVMSEWAAGITWRTEAKSHVTIRHRAGNQDFFLSSAGKIKLSSGAVHTQHPITLEDQHNFRTTDYSGSLVRDTEWIGAKKKKGKGLLKRKLSKLSFNKSAEQNHCKNGASASSNSKTGASFETGRCRRFLRPRKFVKYTFSSDDEGDEC